MRYRRPGQSGSPDHREKPDPINRMHSLVRSASRRFLGKVLIEENYTPKSSADPRYLRFHKSSASPPGNERDDRAAEELSKVVGLDARSQSAAEENAGETPKSPEQSENVYENKGPDAEGVRR